MCLPHSEDEDRGFIVDAAGPNGLSGVFEDDGETGYLYVYEPDGRGILAECHVYDRSALTNPRAHDISVAWDGARCKVFVCGKEAGALEAPGI